MVDVRLHSVKPMGSQHHAVHFGAVALELLMNERTGHQAGEKPKKKKESATAKTKAECILWDLVTLGPRSEQKQLDQTSMNERGSEERWKENIVENRVEISQCSR